MDGLVKKWQLFNFCHLEMPLTNSGGYGWLSKEVTTSYFPSICHSKMLLTNSGGHRWPGKKVTALYFSNFFYLEIPLTDSDRHRWLGKEVIASCLSSFCHSKMAFGLVISSKRLRKKDLGRIFHYAYKYKIAICTGGLPFHQSSNLKSAITTFFYSMSTSLLSTGGLSYI